MVRDTDATVVVPIYRLANKEGTGGTAPTVIPQMADLISDLVDQHGALPPATVYPGSWETLRPMCCVSKTPR
jgi:hypothetical protein